MGPAKAPGLIEGRDKRRGDEGADARGGRQPLHHRVGGRGLDDRGIGDGQVRGQLLPHGEQGPERGRQLGRKRELLHVGAEPVGIPGPDPQPLTAHERPHQGDGPAPRAHEQVPHAELAAHLALFRGHPVRRTRGPDPARLGQHPGIAPVGLHASAPFRIHHRLARFQREAQVLASLNHPNIAAIHGLEESEGTRALVLELVEGPTLADRISQGPIPLDEALPIAKQIAEALEGAHEAGVIHRDLKPANIKVRDDGTVKVLDFGLAKAFQPDASDVSASMSPTISLTAAATQMGVIMGTAAYMSPEQARGKTVDRRADIWSFGVVLYEMLTGVRPFRGEDVSLTLASVMKSDVDVKTLPPDLPETLRTVLRRCLEKDPLQRIRDVGDLRLAMEGAFETTAGAPSEPIVAPTLRLWQRPAPVAVAVLASLAVGGVAVWSLTRPATPRVARFPIPLAAEQDFSFLGRPSVAISPDGSHVVYAANRSLWLRPVDQLQAVQVPGTEEEARGPFFSADGQSIGFWASGQLKKVAVSGGAPVTIADVPSNPSGASWGADDMILYQQPDGIMQVPGTSGTPELLIPAEGSEGMHGPQMLAGGEWVLFTVRAAGQASWDEAQIVAQSVMTGERTVLIDGGRDGRYLPTGHLVYGLGDVLVRGAVRCRRP